LILSPPTAAKEHDAYAALQQLNAKKKTSSRSKTRSNFASRNQPDTVSEKKGMTCQRARSVLRQDPDVIMVGEIRDKETASWHPVPTDGSPRFSTLHTNDAASAVAA